MATAAGRSFRRNSWGRSPRRPATSPAASPCSARSAGRAAPRLLLPLPESDYALVYPLARGWSAVVDVRDTSCRLSHLATGATATLPNLNAVRATPTSRVVRIGYEYLGDDRDAAAASPETETAAARVPGSQRNFRLKRRFRAAAAAAANRRRRRRRPSRWKVRMDPRWKTSLRPEWRPITPVKMKIPFLYYHFYMATHLQFSDTIHFAAHVPAGGGGTDGMLVMMYHPLQGQTGLVFCRPGDAAWTKVANPVAEYVDDDDDDDSGSSSPFCFVDFAFLDGKVFALDKHGVTAVFDAATLEVLDLVDLPPETPNFSTKIFPYVPNDDDDEGNDNDGDQQLISCLHLVALPSSRLLLVRIKVRSAEPEDFDVFELAGSSDEDGSSAWCKVTGIAGGYDLFLDGHHATFGRGGGGGRGSRIYYVYDKHRVISSSSAAYCYSMLEDKLECVYRPPDESDCEYATRPSWFVA